jgi:hypothetical protein
MLYEIVNVIGYINASEVLGMVTHSIVKEVRMCMEAEGSHFEHIS